MMTPALRFEIQNIANANGWTFTHAAAIVEGRTCRCAKCAAARRLEKLQAKYARATSHERFAEDLKAKFHGGKCAFCSTHVAPFGRLACARCSRDLDAKHAAKEAQEAAWAAEAEAENRAEASAAFGPGVRVVNVLTGESYITR